MNKQTSLPQAIRLLLTGILLCGMSGCTGKSADHPVDKTPEAPSPVKREPAGPAPSKRIKIYHLADTPEPLLPRVKENPVRVTALVLEQILETTASAP